jgi:hypothetical protein
MRVALVAPVVAVALLASSSGYNPSIAGAAGCTSFFGGTAAILDPLGTVSGTVNASACDYGVVYDLASSGGTINGATIYGAKSGDGVLVLNATAPVTIENSIIRNNFLDGVDVESSVPVTIQSTSIYSNTMDGLRIFDTNATLFNVKVNNNTGVGFDFATGEAAPGQVVNAKSVYAVNNGTDGIYVNDANVNINSGIVTGNKGNGIHALCVFDTAHSCMTQELDLTGVNVNSNGLQGLLAEDAGVNAFSSNFSLNGQNGIFLETGSSVLTNASKMTSNKLAGAYLVDDASIKEPFLQMQGSFAMYNAIGLDVEDTNPAAGGVDVSNHSRACANSVVDAESDGATIFVDGTSQVCVSKPS